jgi:hypothetical protein
MLNIIGGSGKHKNCLPGILVNHFFSQLVSSEIVNLWSSYIPDRLNICMLTLYYEREH